jgi:all-trans-retinol dehydrogenase (NAD+)
MDSKFVLQLVLEAVTCLGYALFAIIYDTIKFFIPYKYRAKSVANEIILVTGSGSGMGRSLSKKFAKLDAVVVLLDIDERGNAVTLKEICDAGGTAHAFQCDLTNKDEIYEVAKKVFFKRFAKTNYK